MIGDTAELVAEVKAELGDEWDQLTPGERAEVRVATLDLYDLIEDGLKGKDVRGEIAFVKATMSDWAFVSAKRARDAVIKAAKRRAKAAATFLLSLAAGM